MPLQRPIVRGLWKISSVRLARTMKWRERRAPEYKKPRSRTSGGDETKLDYLRRRNRSSLSQDGFLLVRQRHSRRPFIVGLWRLHNLLCYSHQLRV